MGQLTQSAEFFGFTLLVRRISGARWLSKRLANRLLAIAPTLHTHWNHGNAIHQANLALGEIALAEDNTRLACEHLLAAGASLGSPQLNSFGPNMRLALKLLERGERKSVLEYFESCRRFWKTSGGKLDAWKADVEAGRTPDFKANLWY